MELKQGNCIETHGSNGSRQHRPDSHEPPYNVGIEYNSWNDSMEIADYLRFTEQWLTEAYRILKQNGGRIAINIPYEINIQEKGGRIFLTSEYWQLMKRIGYKWAGIVELHEKNPQRVKNTAWGSFMSSTAPCIYNPKECVIIAYKGTWKKEGISYFKGFSDKETDQSLMDEEKGNKRILYKEFVKLTAGIWEYRAETKGLTQANFSVELPKDAIKILSVDGDVVLDPFMGSGTTGVACQQLGREFVGCEISPHYFNIAEQRITEAINQKKLDCQRLI